VAGRHRLLDQARRRSVGYPPDAGGDRRAEHQRACPLCDHRRRGKLGRLLAAATRGGRGWGGMRRRTGLAVCVSDRAGARRPHRGVTSMTLHRRSLLKLAGATAASAGLGIGAPAIVRAATPVKMTLPWLPLGTFSYAFVANKMGFWDKRGLEVTIDR